MLLLTPYTVSTLKSVEPGSALTYSLAPDTLHQRRGSRPGEVRTSHGPQAEHGQVRIPV